MRSTSTSWISGALLALSSDTCLSKPDLIPRVPVDDRMSKAKRYYVGRIRSEISRNALEINPFCLFCSPSLTDKYLHEDTIKVSIQDINQHINLVIFQE